jgi:dsDNA-specific endonuclease/ATPase MutS2
MAENNINELYKDVYQLKADMQHVNSLIDRLDIAISQLSNVSKNISELLAVQGTRLQYQEKMSEQLSQLIQNTDKESEKSNNEIERNFNRKIDDLESELLSEIKSLKEENKKQHEEMKTKLALVEKWIWVVTGGAAVIGFLISKASSYIKF